MSIKDLVNPHILNLRPYEPGKPMEELEREIGISSSIKLASNENPLGPSPKAVEALHREFSEVNRYPDDGYYALRTRLSEKLGVEPGGLVFGCGADEVLELVAKTLVSPGDEIVMPWPSFSMYPILAQGMGGVSVQIPLRDDFSHDLPAMARAVGEKTKIVFVCNPNNPTGTSIGASEFDAFLADLPESVVLVVDEAYADFARREDFPQTLDLLQRRPGTLVLRTFSKIYGLAGMRIGYGVADLELAGYLGRARIPFSVNRLAAAAALAALDDDEHVRRTRELNAKGIEYLEEELAALGLDVYPTDANFILVRAGADAYEKLLLDGVIVRPMQSFGLDEHVRITIGTPEENERVVKALRKLWAEDR
jgi:histidinol-phosphate aminotransferase